MGERLTAVSQWELPTDCRSQVTGVTAVSFSPLGKTTAGLPNHHAAVVSQTAAEPPRHTFNNQENHHAQD